MFIVDDADRMTGPAPQAILKTLEEPPAHTVIVLVLSQLARAARDGALPLSDLPLPAAADRGTRRSCPMGGRGSTPPRCPRSRRAGAGGADAILRVGEALGRDRRGAETLVEACWLHYRDLLCCEGGRQRGELAVFDDAARAPGVARAR